MITTKVVQTGHESQFERERVRDRFDGRGWLWKGHYLMLIASRQPWKDCHLGLLVTRSIAKFITHIAISRDNRHNQKYTSVHQWTSTRSDDLWSVLCRITSRCVVRSRRQEEWGNGGKRQKERDRRRKMKVLCSWSILTLCRKSRPVLAVRWSKNVLNGERGWYSNY